jgi:CsoR family transcriptional regulator, copper-sensing transcriptional repressor
VIALVEVGGSVQLSLLKSTQLSGVSTPLESVAYKLLDDHVNHCVAHALTSGDEGDAETKTRELLEAAQRFAGMR